MTISGLPERKHLLVRLDMMVSKKKDSIRLIKNNSNWYLTFYSVSDIV